MWLATCRITFNAQTGSGSFQTVGGPHDACSIACCNRLLQLGIIGNGGVPEQNQQFLKKFFVTVCLFQRKRFIPMQIGHTCLRHSG